MKQKLLLFTALILLYLPCKAFATDPHVEFTYDQAGNRLSRAVILPPSGSKKHTDNTLQTDSVVVAAPLGDRTVIVYPNPTKGALAVEVKGGNADDKVKVVLYNSNGQQLKVIEATPGTTPVDMTLYPASWYMLRVQAGDKVTEFKIIKQ